MTEFCERLEHGIDEVDWRDLWFAAGVVAALVAVILLCYGIGHFFGTILAKIR